MVLSLDISYLTTTMFRSGDMQDFTIKQKYLVTFAVGYDQKEIIDAAVKKVSEEPSMVKVSLNDCQQL